MKKEIEEDMAQLPNILFFGSAESTMPTNVNTTTSVSTVTVVEEEGLFL